MDILLNQIVNTFTGLFIHKGNIPGNKVTKGETLVEYLQPFPQKGTGYHRINTLILKSLKRRDCDMKEPIYEYDFPPPYIKPQSWFPLRQPFNLYMDKYRDPKQINKEFLLRKLKNVHPFKGSPPPLPYPNAQYFDGYVPTWLKLEIRKSRLKWGRINDIE
ncbi:hypothetical protein NQ317_002796 [Molorchus minor]|uniref:Uncharacterized protein n=1 Tax=Molorchus minor TaxID=1323400 RepID=A0ABQ9J6M6_9CUCU|nr:hypothetical protein NQ317_002796 [Molorchus minor]